MTVPCVLSTSMRYENDFSSSLHPWTENKRRNHDWLFATRGITLRAAPFYYNGEKKECTLPVWPRTASISSSFRDCGKLQVKELFLRNIIPIASKNIYFSKSYVIDVLSFFAVISSSIMYLHLVVFIRTFSKNMRLWFYLVTKKLVILRGLSQCCY